MGNKMTNEKRISDSLVDLLREYPNYFELSKGLVRYTELDLGISISTGKILSGDFELVTSFEEEKALLREVKIWILKKLED